MPRPPRLTPQQGHRLYGELQSAWRLALHGESPSWKALRRLDLELRALEALGFDTKPGNRDLEVE